MYKKKEKNIIILRSVTDQIDGLLNKSNIKVIEEDHQYQSIIFNNYDLYKLFTIGLTDLLSTIDQKVFKETKMSYLKQLDLIFKSSGKLRENLSSFIGWLNSEITIEDIYLAFSEKTVGIKIKRINLIKLVGNSHKHNILRFYGGVDDFVKAVESYGDHIKYEEAVINIDYVVSGWLDGIVSYQTNKIAEYLTNINRDILNYFIEVYVPLRDEFTAGEDINLAKLFYNNLYYWSQRGGPIIKPIQILPILTKRY